MSTHSSVFVLSPPPQPGINQYFGTLHLTFIVFSEMLLVWEWVLNSDKSLGSPADTIILFITEWFQKGLAFLKNEVSISVIFLNIRIQKEKGENP